MKKGPKYYKILRGNRMEKEENCLNFTNSLQYQLDSAINIFCLKSAVLYVLKNSWSFR